MHPIHLGFSGYHCRHHAAQICVYIYRAIIPRSGYAHTVTGTCIEREPTSQAGVVPKVHKFHRAW